MQCKTKATLAASLCFNPPFSAMQPRQDSHWPLQSCFWCPCQWPTEPSNRRSRRLCSKFHTVSVTEHRCAFKRSCVNLSIALLTWYSANSNTSHIASMKNLTILYHYSCGNSCHCLKKEKFYISCVSIHALPHGSWHGFRQQMPWSPSEQPASRRNFARNLDSF